MAKQGELRYWDSCCFIGWLANEPDKAADCGHVLTAASQRRVKLVTSTLTIAEVVKLRGHPQLQQSHMVEAFFQHSYIVIRNLDRRTAELARRLVWFENVDAKDAVHVATALLANCGRMDTTD